VLLLLVRLEEGEDVDMRVARSSYLAWDSRGSWPKSPKAHGAAVDVGNREKEEVTEGILEDEDGIYDYAAVVWCGVVWCAVGGTIGVVYSVWSVSGGGGVGEMRPWRGTPSSCAYICAPHP
jgi:hypothetical protein